MSPTSYQTAPPRISIINNGHHAVKPRAPCAASRVPLRCAHVVIWMSSLSYRQEQSTIIIIMMMGGLFLSLLVFGQWCRAAFFGPFATPSRALRVRAFDKVAEKNRVQSETAPRFLFLPSFAPRP